MNDFEDRELRARFQSLREQDGPLAPPFAALWSRALREQHARSRRVVTGLAAAAILVSIVSTLTWKRLHDSPAPPDATTAVASWRAPTDALLSGVHLELYDTPSIRMSAIDRFIPSSSLFKGE